MSPELALQKIQPVCTMELLGICFVTPAVGPEISIFRFAEFITALALLVVLYTISDVRYRFRVAVAPLPLVRLTYALLAIIGFFSLISGIWFAERWPTPSFLVSHALWQGVLGSAFLALVLIWMFYAFIRPPIFSKRNYKRYADEVFRYIVRGSDSELPIIASELGRSASSLVTLSKETQRRSPDGGHAAAGTRRRIAEEYAYEILWLIGNRKFCRHIVASSPGTAIMVFTAMAEADKYNLPLGQFAKNVSAEAIANNDSILYHEDDGYSSGLLGHLRPFSKALYGNYKLVESLASGGNSPLDIDHHLMRSWSSAQLEAYTRAFKITFENYLASERWGQHSYALYRALTNIENSCSDVYKLKDALADPYSTQIYKRLRVTVDLVKSTVDSIGDRNPTPEAIALRARGHHIANRKDFYDHLADLLFDIIHSAAYVTSPQEVCWQIQHNAVWGEIHSLAKSNKAWRIVHFKLHRLLFDEIQRLGSFPNFKSARILAYCLNIFGLRIGKRDGYGKEYYALAYAVIAWTKANYLALIDRQPEVAKACLVDSISFDAAQGCLIKTYPQGLRLQPQREYLPLHRGNIAKPKH